LGCNWNSVGPAPGRPGAPPPCPGLAGSILPRHDLEQRVTMSTAPVETYHPGLEGVIANETAISSVEGKEGAGGLEYRGYGHEELAERVSYDETAFLLLHGDLPTRSQLQEFQARLRAARAIPEPLVALYRQVPPSVTRWTC